MSELESAAGRPNLTPILDMVFQLITFFMLVINFKSAALDLTLKLPVVGSARPVDTKGKVELLVFNVNSEGRLKAGGQVRSDPEAYIRHEANASLIAARVKNPELQFGQELPETVVLRADRDTPFRLLNRIIRACQEGTSPTPMPATRSCWLSDCGARAWSTSARAAIRWGRRRECAS